MTSSFHPPQRTLMGPGPSDVNPRILEAMARPTIGHLDPLFVQMMDFISGPRPMIVTIRILLKFKKMWLFQLPMP